MRIAPPDTDILRRQCSQGRSVLVSAPFYSADSLSWITPSKRGKLEFWTRLNPFDWATGFSDPDALLQYLKGLGEGNVTLSVNRALHAKIYLVDDTWAWVGSPNLTGAAFHQNIELICELERAQIPELSKAIGVIRPSLTVIGLNTLDSFVAATKDAVEEYREHGDIELPEDMQAAVDLADEILAPKVAPLGKVTIAPLDEFLRFLKAHRKEPAASEIIARADGKHNLQGHVNQSYYGAVLFLSDPKRKPLLAKLAQMSVEGLPRLVDPALVKEWAAFLDLNAKAKQEGVYSLSILRRILPESWGGYTSSGGGGISTLKRILPLVARFLLEK